MIHRPILERLHARAAPSETDGAPTLQLIEARRGAGKSRLLGRLAGTLDASGSVAVLVDLERICAGPLDLAEHLPAACARAVRPSRPAGEAAPIDFGPRTHRIAASLASEAARRKPDPVLLLDLALTYPRALSDDLGRNVVLLLDEMGEMVRLARHAGLRDSLDLAARRIAGAGGVALVGAISPASRASRLITLMRSEAAAAGREMIHEPLPPLPDGDLACLLAEAGCAEWAAAGDLDAWRRATQGHPLYADILARRVAAEPGRDLAFALALEISAPHGALHRECRFDYHLLVERSRGHSAVRMILEFLARNEGANLTAVARRLRIRMPTALDYLSWLLEVGLIRREGSGYVVADALLRVWVMLNGAEPAEPRVEVARLLARPLAPPRPASRPRGPRPGSIRARPMPPPASPGRDRFEDHFIEID